MIGWLQSLKYVGSIFQRGAPRSEVVAAFWAHMQAHYGTCLVNKLSNAESELIALALDRLGVLDRGEFLENFATTIGKRIYVPFEPGVPRKGWDLWSQIVICVHEHQHVVQHEREGIEYEARYLIDRAARTNYEVEAMRSNLELAYWHTGKTPSPKALAKQLYNYACRAGDVAVAEKSLALAAVSVRSGAVLNEATKVALDWLNEHAPEFRSK